MNASPDWPGASVWLNSPGGLGLTSLSSPVVTEIELSLHCKRSYGVIKKNKKEWNLRRLIICVSVAFEYYIESNN